MTLVSPFERGRICGNADYRPENLRQLFDFFSIRVFGGLDVCRILFRYENCNPLDPSDDIISFHPDCPPFDFEAGFDKFKIASEIEEEESPPPRRGRNPNRVRKCKRRYDNPTLRRKLKRKFK